MKNENKAQKVLIGRIIFIVLSMIVFYFVAFQKNITIAKLETENKNLTKKIEKMDEFLKKNNLTFIDNIEKKQEEQEEQKEQKAIIVEKQKINTDEVK
jgi:hypothetical protein